jgi:hypothetical protein
VATVSVKDTWWSDPRRNRLITALGGQIHEADGLMLECWRIGQEFAARGSDLPSFRIFDPSKLQAILSSGLAEKRGDGIYIFGSRDAAEYRIRRKESGKLGGEKSAEMRRNKINDLGEANAKQNEPFSSSSSFSSSSQEHKSYLNPHPVDETLRKKDPTAEHFSVRMSEREVKDKLLPLAPNKMGWTAAWREVIKPQLAANPDILPTLEAAIRNFSAEMKRLKREESKIMTFANFFLKGFWRDFINPEKNEDFSQESKAQDYSGVSEVFKNHEGRRE